MLPFFADYFERLTTFQGEFERALADLPQAGIDWAPGPEMNSIGVLSAHVAGSTRYWIGDVVVRQSTQRVRAEEFRTHGVPAATLREQLATTIADSRSVLESLTLEMLAETRVAPTNGDTVTVAWSLLHALEHMALHAGHVQLTRQMWDQRSLPHG